MKENIRDFIEALSSSAPAPGGGGASALAGALGASLGMMVGNITSGKSGEEAADQIKPVLEQLLSCRERLMELVDEDEKAFLPVIKAYGIDKARPDRGSIIENALCGATDVPVNMMETALSTLTCLREMADLGSRGVLSDVAVGAHLAQAALEGASFNVFINADMMKDREKAEAYIGRAIRMIDEGRSLLTETADTVLAAIRRSK